MSDAGRPAPDSARTSWGWSGWGGLLAVVAVVLGAQALWRGQSDRAAATALQALARPGDIHLVSSETCIFCTRARAWLTEHRVPFTECLIERDAACRAQYQALQAAGTPTLLVRGQRQLGFSPAAVAQRLRDSPPAATQGG